MYVGGGREATAAALYGAAAGAAMRYTKDITKDWLLGGVPMEVRLGVIVGTRRLRELGSQRKVITVKLGRPRKVTGADWLCPYHISGLGIRSNRYAYGVDAIQALLLAIEGIRATLESSGKQFSWVGGEPGDTGFVRFLPTYFGRDFSKQLERLIDLRVNRLARAIRRRPRERISTQLKRKR